MKKIIFCLLLCFLVNIHTGFSQKVFLLYDKSVPQAEYAAKRLNQALKEKNYTIMEDRKGYDFLINIGVHSVNLDNEAFAIIPEGKIITINGGDERGMVYGSLSLVEDLLNGVALQNISNKTETPHHSLRAIKHNTPCYSYRSSSALDLHYETVRDVKYWESFLDMMAENRFNPLSLWNLHPFVFMIKSKNFPEASPFSEAEMKEWKNLHKEIFQMADERAIDTYIIPFNIFVSPEFSKAHNVAHKTGCCAPYEALFISGIL